MSGNEKREPLIQVQNLGKSFGNIEVLKDITVDIYKGDVVFVVGPSGSGKSTFLRCLNRLEEPTKAISILKVPILQIRKPILTNTVRKWEWYSSSSTCSRIWIS